MAGGSIWTQVMEALPSAPGRSAPARRHPSALLVMAAVGGLLVVAGVCIWTTFANPTVVSPTPKVVAVQATKAAMLEQVVRNPALDQLVETVKALEFSQQEAIDQLQVLQQLLTAQKAETRKATDQVAALNDKFDALRQSFASAQTTPTEAEVAPREKAKPAAAHHAHRLTPRKSRTASASH
jgi:septal ring factor EnvC (AmiA/AmiB activator)